jgi:hypothetical protein
VSARASARRRLQGAAHRWCQAVNATRNNGKTKPGRRKGMTSVKPSGPTTVPTTVPGANGNTTKTRSIGKESWHRASPIMPRTGPSSSSACAGDTGRMSTLRKNFAPATTDSPPRTTTGSWRGKTASAESASGRGASSASIIVMRPARCAGCFVTTATGGSDSTTTTRPSRGRPPHTFCARSAASRRRSSGSGEGSPSCCCSQPRRRLASACSTRRSRQARAPSRRPCSSSSPAALDRVSPPSRPHSPGRRSGSRPASFSASSRRQRSGDATAPAGDRMPMRVAGPASAAPPLAPRRQPRRLQGKRQVPRDVALADEAWRRPA